MCRERRPDEGDPSAITASHRTRPLRLRMTRLVTDARGVDVRGALTRQCRRLRRCHRADQSDLLIKDDVYRERGHQLAKTAFARKGADECAVGETVRILGGDAAGEEDAAFGE